MSDLGEYLVGFGKLVFETGWDPEDGCVLCGRKQVILHPVGKAWACSECHEPPEGYRTHWGGPMSDVEVGRGEPMKRKFHHVWEGQHHCHFVETSCYTRGDGSNMALSCNWPLQPEDDYGYCSYCRPPKVAEHLGGRE